jgi:hypothetical protein
VACGLGVAPRAGHVWGLAPTIPARVRARVHMVGRGGWRYLQRCPGFPRGDSSGSLGSTESVPAASSTWGGRTPSPWSWPLPLELWEPGGRVGQFLVADPPGQRVPARRVLRVVVHAWWGAGARLPGVWRLVGVVAELPSSASRPLGAPALQEVIVTSNKSWAFVAPPLGVL